MRLLLKFKHWCTDILTTATVEGPFLFFQRMYFLHTVVTVLERIYLPIGSAFRQRLQAISNREIIISNRIGFFSVNSKNDSLTKSNASFEVHHHQWLSHGGSRNLFLDIGANIGFYSIIALTQYGYKESHAFEPNPETYRRLSQNIKLNGLSDRMHAVPVGLSDTRSTAHLGTKAVHTGASSFVLSPQSSGVTPVEVQVVTFDEYAHKHNLTAERISFIKIDVEGFEWHVLSGMRNTLTALQPGTCLFIEIHPRSPDAKCTKAFLLEAGFSLSMHTAQHNFLYKKER